MTSNNNIPQGYKKTDLGIIPEDWYETKIGSLGNIVGGGTPNTLDPSFWNGHIQWYTPAEIGNCKYIKASMRTITEKGLNHSSAKILPKGTILLTTRASIGQSAILKTQAATNQGFQSIIVNNECSNEFVYYLLKTKVREMINVSSGSTFLEISKHKLSTISVVIPPLAEQKAIATALSDVDALIVALDKKIEKKKLIKQGAMQQLLTCKKRLPGFTEEWVETTIGNISELMKGSGLSKEKLSMSGKYKCILYGEIFTTYNYVVEKCKSRTDSREGLKSEIGDVILPGSTTTKGIDLAKAVCIKENDILLGGDVIIIRNSRKEFCSDFLAIYLSEVNKETIAEKSQGTTIIHLHAPQLAEVKICIPSSIKEQQAIATILSDMDKEISDLETKRDKYRQIKSGMMQKLLTGQIRLK